MCVRAKRLQQQLDITIILTLKGKWQDEAIWHRNAHSQILSCFLAALDAPIRSPENRNPAVRRHRLENTPNGANGCALPGRNLFNQKTATATMAVAVAAEIRLLLGALT